MAAAAAAMRLRLQVLSRKNCPGKLSDSNLKGPGWLQPQSDIAELLALPAGQIEFSKG